MTMTTKTITNSQIVTIRDQAGTAGDMLQCRLCDIALGGMSEDEIRELVSSTLDMAERTRLARILLTISDYCSDVTASRAREAVAATV
jgi:hypothetical protein